MKDKRVIRQVLTIYLVCFVARIFEYFVLRTDQTILGEAFIHKLFGIIVICLVVKRSGETLSDIGFVKNGYIRSAVKGLALGLSMFAIGYFVEILILMQNRTYAGIRFYVSAYAVDTNIVLIVLSVVALWYDGTMICISTIFETLLLSAVCEVIKHMMYKIDIANIYLGILLNYRKRSNGSFQT